MAQDSRGIQQRLPSHARRSWIVPAVLIAGGVFLLELVGMLEPLDDLAYDWATQLLARRAPVPAEVLLVYANPQPAETEAEQLLTLIDRLEELGARHIAFAMELPRPALERCRHQPTMTVGSPVVRDRDDPQLFHSISAEFPEPLEPHQAVVAIPPPRRGIFREQLTRVRVGGEWHTTLESAVARSLQLHSGSEDRFRIRFRGDTGSLPHVTLQTAVEGGLVPELARGRVVLIGRGEAVNRLGIATSATGEHGQMPVLEFHGHALNTLLTGAAVDSAGLGVNWLIYVAVAIVCGVLFETATARGCGLMLLALLTIDAACMLLALSTTRMWLPVSGAAIVKVMCFVRVVQRQNAFAQVAWQQLIHDLHAKLRQRRWPTGFFSEEEPWSQIISFVHQTLNLNRLIILERLEGSYHVREVKALNCTLSDIDEQRRDTRRWPYHAALEEKQPIAVSADRPFLRLVSDENQYLVPLVFGGEVFGFMALGVACSEISDSVQFEGRLSEFAGQIAELLYRRHHVLSEQKRDANWFGRFRQAADTRIYAELVHATHLIERRAARLESIFDRSLTAAAIYDVFGRLMMINTKMGQLLQNEGVVASDLTTVDLISLLTGRDQHAARNMLRQVICGKRHESVPVTLEHQKGDYLFNVYPMDLEVPESHAVAGADSPFQLQGILCELVDRSDEVRTHQLRQQITEGFGKTLRDDFAAVDMAATLITGDKVPAEERRTYGDLIHGRIETALRSLNEFEQLMPADLYSAEEKCLPIAPLPVVEQAVAAVASQAEERGIEVRLVRSQLVSQVLAAPSGLPRVFETILEFLLLDAADDSELDVSLEETPNEVVLTCTNQGFGVAISSVQELLEQDGVATPEGQDLREALDRVHSWGGRMAAASEIGRGTTIKLFLRTFR